MRQINWGQSNRRSTIRKIDERAFHYEVVDSQEYQSRASHLIIRKTFFRWQKKKNSTKRNAFDNGEKAARWAQVDIFWLKWEQLLEVHQQQWTKEAIYLNATREWSGKWLFKGNVAHTTPSSTIHYRSYLIRRHQVCSEVAEVVCVLPLNWIITWCLLKYIWCHQWYHHATKSLNNFLYCLRGGGTPTDKNMKL